MGAGYTTIQWNKQKLRYDKVILIFSVGFLLLYILLNLTLRPLITVETLIIRAFGLLAILLLHIILMTGPLARLDPRFLVLLYNRRHLGVTTFFFALIHGSYSIFHFHTSGNENPLRSLLASNVHYNSFIHYPFEILGLFALVIMAIMAFTSHDFWLKNLGPMVWKRLHMMVYSAYFLLVFHVILGALQNEHSMFMSYMVGAGALVIMSLHLLTGYREFKKDKKLPEGTDNWIRVGNLNDIPDKRAVIVNALDQQVAVFRNGRKVSAISNQCKHQGGPIGEGKMVRGCVICPWHGYQYYPHNGCSPPPFEEKLETFDLKLVEEDIYLYPRPHPAGTEVAPLDIPKSPKKAKP